MFALDCPTCGIAWLVDTASILSLVNTDAGPVVRARCPDGHVVTHAFRARALATASAVRGEAAG